MSAKWIFATHIHHLGTVFTPAVPTSVDYGGSIVLLQLLLEQSTCVTCSMLAQQYSKIFVKTNSRRPVAWAMVLAHLQYQPVKVFKSNSSIQHRASIVYSFVDKAL